MKKRILVASGLAVTGICAAALILRKSKKNKRDKKDRSKKKPEIELWDLDDFDTDLEEDSDDDIEEPWNLSMDDDEDNLDSFTNEELDKLAEELINEFEKRCRAESIDDKKSREEVGCRSR